MKQISIVLFALIMVFAISCEKEIVPTTPEVHKTSIEDFRQLVMEYQSLDSYGNDFSKAPSTDEVQEIVSDDIDGAETGTKMGAPFGPWGMFTGGLLLGALNSWAKSGSKEEGNNEVTNKEFSWVFENNFDPLIEYPTNPNNPFEEIGMQHNEILIKLAEGLNGGQLTEPNDNATLYKYLIPYTLSNYPDANDLIANPTFVEMVTNTNMPLENVLSADAYEIHQVYWETAKNINSVEDYTNFTIDYENLLLEAELEENDKNALLAGLAVSRYSNAYWTNIFGM